jgi:hypothetical protein
MSKRLPGIKQGVAFSFYADYSLDGSPEVFPATDLTSQVRADNNLLLTQLAIAADAGVPGRFLFSATTVETAKWPVGDVYFDIKRTSGGVTTATDTVCVAVAKKVTA